ncbi:MAG: dockerin type I domain-containing protein, partial [Planctomycetota bacterium]
GNSPATIQVHGNLSLGPNAELRMEITSLGNIKKFDQLIVAGEFQANGILTLENHLPLQNNAAQESLGFLERIPLVEADTISGEFDVIQGNDFLPNESFYLDVLQTASKIEVVVMPTTWHNAHNALDVNGDGHVSALDALFVIDWLNQGRRMVGLPRAAAAGKFNLVDINNDGFASSIDALSVIAALNIRKSGEGEATMQEFVPDDLGVRYYAMQVAYEDILEKRKAR